MRVKIDVKFVMKGRRREEGKGKRIDHFRILSKMKAYIMFVT